MPLFQKNPNEQNYQDGHKHFTNVIKNTAPPDAIMFRQPEEDFNTNTTLIVMPGEEAVFIHSGIIEGVLPPGTHVLKTENYPFLTRVRTMLTGGISIYNCVIVFVRTTTTMELEWGTGADVRDPVWDLSTRIGIGGIYRITVADASLLLTKLFGTSHTTLSGLDIAEFFRSQIVTKIKSNVLRTITSSNAEIVGIEANLDVFSEILTPSIAAVMEDYGLALQAFTIDRLVITDEQTRRILEENIAKSKSMDYMGNNWVKDKYSDILMAMATNSGSGGMANTFAGMGMGMATMPIFQQMAQQMGATTDTTNSMLQAMQAPSVSAGAKLSYRQKQEQPLTVVPAAPAVTKACPKCKAQNPTSAKFCGACGEKLRRTNQCPKCGATLSDGNLFCTECGESL